MKQLNSYEIKGLAAMLNGEIAYQGGNEDVENYKSGTRENGLINLQNTYFSELEIDPAYPKLGAYGLTDSLDIVLQFWDEDEEKDITYVVPGSVFCTSDNWKKEAIILK